MSVFSIECSVYVRACVGVRVSCQDSVSVKTSINRQTWLRVRSLLNLCLYLLPGSIARPLPGSSARRLPPRA